MTQVRKATATLLALAALMLATPPAASAQDNQDFQTWSALLGGANLDVVAPGLRLWFDGHTRRGDSGTVVIVRPGVGYQLAPWASVWLGYAWVPVTNDALGEVANEHRVWQQLILNGSWLGGRLNAQSRTRIEQRFLAGTPELGHRARQFVRADYKFGEAPWGFAVWDELFWGINDPGWAPQGFDQNRIFVGPAFHAVDGLRIEFGYLNAVLSRGGATQIQHALALNFFVSL